MVPIDINCESKFLYDSIRIIIEIKNASDFFKIALKKKEEDFQMVVKKKDEEIKKNHEEMDSLRKKIPIEEENK